MCDFFFYFVKLLCCKQNEMQTFQVMIYGVTVIPIELYNSNELRLNGGGRVYFASKPNNDFSGDMWWKVVQNTYFQ